MIGSGHMINFNHLLMAKSNSTLARSRVFRGFKTLKQGTCTRAKNFLAFGNLVMVKKVHTKFKNEF